MKTKFLTIKELFLLTGLVLLTTFNFSCNGDDDLVQNNPIAISNIKLNGNRFDLNYKLAIQNPKLMGVCFSKNGQLTYTPSQLQPNGIIGCGIANAPVQNDNVISIQFFDNSDLLNPLTLFTSGSYTSMPTDGITQPGPRYFFCGVIKNGTGTYIHSSGSLLVIKGSNSINIKGTVTLVTGDVLTFPSEGIDVPYSNCQ